MSEVTDTCQIVMIAGKMIVTAAELSWKAALLLLKVYNTLYLGKWKGSTNFQRFRSIKGEDYEFINICTEDPQKLLRIEKEMEAHNLLFARLPDLCGGDGNTQYVIARSDMHIFAAFLMDHTHGELKEVKAGPVTESDYAQTAVHPENGEYTDRFRTLNQSAREQYRQASVHGEREPERMLPLLFGRHVEKPAGDEAKSGKKLMEDEERPRAKAELSFTDAAGTRMVSWDEISSSWQIRLHDRRLLYEDRMELIYGQPVKEHERWAMFPIYDGEQVVVIPREDVLQGNTGREKRYRVLPEELLPGAILCTGREYILVNLRTGATSLKRGQDLAGGLGMADLTERKRKLENLEHNIRKNAGAEAVPVQKAQEWTLPGRSGR